MTDDSVGFMCAWTEWFNAGNSRLPRVLEFGMGASTLFLRDRAEAIVSFEHDAEWFGRVVKMLEILDLPHPRAILAGRPYSDRIEAEAGTEKFDLISIDGRDRVACLREVLRLDLLAGDGILVLDNTERITTHNGRYAGMAPLLRPDFNVVHFEQLGRDRAGWIPGHRWVTTIAWRRSGVQYTTRGIPI
ncbi:hypothetical protein [Tropicimonas sp.]|uniref:hypothetical protein n=1 Tax=Tropicimonas sp. TaxID=2067044 RepID=UPI003A8741D3